MKKLTLFLVLAGLVVAAPAEARHRKHGKAGCTACAKSKCGCAPNAGYRAAGWGSSWYHTSESCMAVGEIAKDKLVTGEAAAFGRKRHCCCGGHA